MKLYEVSDENFGNVAANFVAEALSERPTLKFTAPTGSTPIALYSELRDRFARGEFSLAQATIFMLDEYVDLPSYPTRSFSSYLDEHLGPLLDEARVYRLDPIRDAVEPARYDATLDSVGGLDLAIIGVGRNGHVGFNEPGASDAQRTHVVTLTPETLTDNFSGEGSATRPTRAVTLGLADLRAARSVLMLISGVNKGPVLAQLLKERRLDEVPATHLLDGNLTLVASHSAMAKARRLASSQGRRGSAVGLEESRKANWDGTKTI